MNRPVKKRMVVHSHAGHDLLHVLTADEEHHRSGGEGDGAGLQVELRVKDESKHHQEDHDDAFDQQTAVLNGFVLIQLQNGVHGLRLHMELAPIDKIKADNGGGQHKEHGNAGVGDEIRKAQPRGAANHNIGGVADQGGGAADVGGHDLGHEEGNGVDPQHAGNGQGHGADEEHCGHIVQEGGQNSGDQSEQHHQRPGPALGDFRGLNGNVFKDAGVFDHGHEKHHADQDPQGVEVHIGKAGFHRQNPGEDQQQGAGDGGHRSVELLGHNGCHGHQKDDNGNDLR